MKYKNLMSKFWEYMLENKDKNKIHQKVYNFINKDYLGAIIVVGDSYYLEPSNSNRTIPDYIFYFVEQWMKKRGYKIV